MAAFSSISRVTILATALAWATGFWTSCVPAEGGDGTAGTSGSAGAIGAAGAIGSAGASGSAGTSGSAGAGGNCATPPTVKMQWTIAVYMTTMSRTCEQAGAQKVQMLMDSTVYEFPCGSYMGSTTAIAPGMYTARLLLTGTNGGVLSQSPTLPLTVPACGTLDFGSVKFNVAAQAGTAGASGSAGSSGTGGMGGGGNTGAAGFTPGTGPCDAKPIFAQHNCAYAKACHDAGGSAAGLDMVTAGWEKGLVGKLPNANLGAQGLRSKCMGAGAMLVAGSQPAKGLFLDKLKSQPQTCGGQMPLIPSYLTPQELDCVQRWANGLTK